MNNLLVPPPLFLFSLFSCMYVPFSFRFCMFRSSSSESLQQQEKAPASSSPSSAAGPTQQHKWPIRPGVQLHVNKKHTLGGSSKNNNNDNGSEGKEAAAGDSSDNVNNLAQGTASHANADQKVLNNAQGESESV